MTTVVAQAEKRIARPLEVVQSQFVDMPHHAATRVHADLEVSNVRPLEEDRKDLEERGYPKA